MQTEYEWGNLSRGYDEDGEPVGISPETAMVVMARLRADPRECMAEARRMLSNMPAEVFDVFIAPIVGDIGWPFRSPGDPVRLLSAEWLRILHPITLAGLCSAEWRKTELFAYEYLFYKESLADIGAVIRNKSEDVWACLGRDSEPCRASLLHHERVAVTAGRFDAPVTLFVLGDNTFKVLDGNHRIASLFTTGLQDKIMIEAWIGRSCQTA